jgi:hypothetical protein
MKSQGRSAKKRKLEVESIDVIESRARAFTTKAVVCVVVGGAVVILLHAVATGDARAARDLVVYALALLGRNELFIRPRNQR